MSYISEFPDYDGKFYCPKGWTDASWHNDTMPRAMLRKEKTGNYTSSRSEVVFSIWQDYVDVGKREYDIGKRYTFCVEVDAELVFFYETDDLEEIKKLEGSIRI